MDEQGTEGWLRDRAGKFTGSRFVNVLARDKRNPEKKLKAWHDLVWEIATERLNEEPTEGPNGYALQWGKDVEPFSREDYELASGNAVEETGFIVHPDFPFVGCSPDGLIGEDGGVEIKSPKNSRIHLERFLFGMPEEYMPQVQGCMWVTGREWWDFVSYDPRAKEPYRLFVVRVERDEEYIKRLEAAVIEAEQAVQELLSSLSGAVIKQAKVA